MEGSVASRPSALDLTRLAVPRCRLGERIGDVEDRVRALGWDHAVVVDDDDVVLGLVRVDALDTDADAPVDHVMERGPRTMRPSVALEDAKDYFPPGSDRILVTNPDGVLFGTLMRADVERRLGEQAA